MKDKYISVCILALASFPFLLVKGQGQIDSAKEYFIQTKEGLCLTNQGTADKLALIRFMASDASDSGQRWILHRQDDGYVIENVQNGLAVDNVGTKYLNLFQEKRQNALPSQQWMLKPVSGKNGYYAIVSANYPAMQWQANYNGTICIADSSRYRTSQWFRINETIQEADSVTEADVEPVVLPGVTEVCFSTAENPKWYTMNAYYANSPSAQKANLVAYYDKANKRWIAKGASNTKVGVDTYTTPDCSLWRLEGTASSFYLVNKHNGLRLAYPAVNSANQRFVLNEDGNTFKISKSANLNASMSADAFYIDPTDASVASVGRINCDGSTVELILYKNGTADVTNGKGSTFIFSEPKMKKVEAKSSNSAIGTVSIEKDVVADSYGNNVFTFVTPDKNEDMPIVWRSAAGTVRINASPANGAQFTTWTIEGSDKVYSTSPTCLYDETSDAVLVAHFDATDGVASGMKTESTLSLSSDGRYLLVPENCGEVAVYSSDGRLRIRVSSGNISLEKLSKGVYVARMHNKGEVSRLVFAR